jgi:transcriptional regulator with XRE-family HTH domain
MSYTRAMTSTQLRRFLKDQGLTQAALARAFEIDPRTVRRYVNDESEIPKVIELACQALATTQKERRK